MDVLLKMEDLEEWLKIEKVDDDTDLADIVYRIKTVIRLIFGTSSVYKLFFTDKQQIFRNVVTNTGTTLPMSQSKNQRIEAEIGQKCPKCGKQQKLKAIPVDQLSVEDKGKGNLESLTCDNCGFNIDLNPVRNQLELQMKKKVHILK